MKEERTTDHTDETDEGSKGDFPSVFSSSVSSVSSMKSVVLTFLFRHPWSCSAIRGLLPKALRGNNLLKIPSYAVSF